MNKIIAICLFVMCSNLLSSQVGIRLHTQKNNFQNWQDIINSSTEPTALLFNTSYGLTLDYWLRLKDYRLEFYPGIGISTSSSTNPPNTNELFPSSYLNNQAYIGINTHVYFMDFKNDCECPTFSKQNGILKKGVFLLLGVNGQFESKSITFDSENISVKDQDIAPNFQLGLGLDIGISDLVTVTPIASVSYTPSTTWANLSANHLIVNVMQPDEASDNLAYRLGIRIGFRPDYLKRR